MSTAADWAVLSETEESTVLMYMLILGISVCISSFIMTVGVYKNKEMSFKANCSLCGNFVIYTGNCG